MKKNLKKVLAASLAATMVMSIPVFADTTAKDDQEATFDKTYVATNEGTESPEETFTFSFEGYELTDSNNNLNVEDMPKIPDSEVEFEKGQAVTGNEAKEAVGVALNNIKWPGVGIYYYKVTENVGNTAGVTYDAKEAFLKVTVAYDQGTDTYYTAFVTLNLADENGDGITDSKVAGFENEYSAGSLAITKDVTGNLGDVEKFFDVTVTFEAPYTIDKDGNKEYEVVMSDIYYSGGTLAEDEEKVWLSGGWTGIKETKINIKDEMTYNFTNIPYGVTYTVVEDDYTSEEKGGYDAATYGFGTSNLVFPESGVITGTPTFVVNDAKHTMTITNNKGTVVDTGISLDNMPYIMVLAMTVLGAFGFVFKKRKEEEIF